jgi:membrane protein DedA with SNARE-associated domain
MILVESNFWNYLFDIHLIIEFVGLLLLLGIINIETGFFLGFILPGGDYMLFAAGNFRGTHYLDNPLFWLVVLLINSSFLYDITGYFKGKWSGGKFLLFNILGTITWVGFLVPLRHFIGKAYPEVIKYSFYILLVFIAIASSPMLKIDFSKVNKP